MSTSIVQNIFSSVLTAFAQPGSGERTTADHDKRWADGSAYRITAVCEPDLIEIEDGHAVRQRIVLSYGAREMFELALKQRSRKTPVGLNLVRESFDLEGVRFSRWAVRD